VMDTVRAPGRSVSIGAEVRRLNPHLFNSLEPEAKKLLNSSPLEPRRIRQRTKTTLTKTEAAALEYVRLMWPEWSFMPHALRLELANGCLYTPDLVGRHLTDPIRVFEVKGKHAWDDSIVKLKVAARDWAAIHFWIIWREGAHWRTQRVEP
jgi:hypothetical protein